MTVLITGGAGFIGSHLAQHLLRCTDHAIVLADNFSDYYDPELKRTNAALFANEPRASFAEGDLTELPFCRELLDRHRPEHVIHLAALPGVPFSLQEPAAYIHNNLTATTALLEAARKHSIKTFLFASSSTVYGLGARSPFIEDAPVGVPASPYGATKRAAEIMGQTFHRLYGVPFTSLRLFNAYGPRLRPDLALSIFTRKILASEPITLFGDGTVLRDFTHVSDICSGFVAALSAQHIAGECINLGHNEPIEVRRLIELIEAAAGKRAIIERHPPRPGDMPLTCADLSKAARLLGYRPKVTIGDGVREFVEWMRRCGPGNS